MAKGKASRRQNQNRQETTESGLTLSRRGSIVILESGGWEQSRLDLSRPEVLDFEYMQHLDLLLDATFARHRPLRVLHAGAGACALALAWATKRPGTTQLAVDPDAGMLRLLRDWRIVSDRSGIKLRAADARAVLEGSNATYDVIVRDAFEGDRTPKSLESAEWSTLVQSRLRPGGLYLANVAHAPGGASAAKADIAATLDCFAGAAAVADRKVWRGVRRGNIAVAAWQEGGADLDSLEIETRRLPLPVAVFNRQQISAWLGGQRPAVDIA